MPRVNHLAPIKQFCRGAQNLFPKFVSVQDKIEMFDKRPLKRGSWKAFVETLKVSVEILLIRSGLEV